MPYVPMKWLAEHVDVQPETTTEKLAAQLVRVGLEEETIHPATVTGPLVVGRVLSLVKETHKNGKTINYCRVDVGPEHNDAPGEGKEPADVASRSIVCGAHNFEVGDSVVVSLPGTVLPGPFPISARKTYGHISDGMICSEIELGLGDDHSGIIVLRDYLGVAEEDVPPPGTDAVELLGLGDEVLEINVTPDRGYCFAMRGVAREYAHSTGAKFADPGLAENLPGGGVPEATPDGFRVVVRDEAPIHGVTGCDRFVTRIVRGVDPSAPTPKWMSTRLRQASMRSISLAVDITNYVMLDLGQPLHAYDLHQVAEPIVVRRAKVGEKLTTLDDVERKLNPEDLLITDSPDGEGSRVLGLAGVMGGASSEITDATTDILVESAHFDPVTVARTSRRHKIPSEAAKRYERGVDPQLAAVAAQRVVDMLIEYGGGKADDAVFDLNTLTPRVPIAFDPQAATRLIGVDYADSRVKGLLEEIGCKIDDAAATWQVTPPSWRPDLTEPADLIEEVARLDGYDEIPSVLPVPPEGQGLTATQQRRRDLERAAAEHGLTQVLSYPFVAEGVFDALYLPEDDERRTALRLTNPLADDQPLMRTELLQTLLAVARRNVARNSGPLAVFETGMVTKPQGRVATTTPSAASRPSDAELDALHGAVPAQPTHLAAVLGGPRGETTQWGTPRVSDWADAIEVVRTLATTVGLDVTATAVQRAPWHPGRCAELRVGETVIGYAGELLPKVVEAFDLPARSVALEVNVDALLAQVPAEPKQIDPVSTYPVAKEDVAIVVASEVTAQQVAQAVREGAGELAEEVRLFDVYEGAPLKEGTKSLAFALKLRAPDRTLTAEETAKVRDAIVAKVGERVQGTLRA